VSQIYNHVRAKKVELRVNENALSSLRNLQASWALLMLQPHQELLHRCAVVSRTVVRRGRHVGIVQVVMDNDCAVKEKSVWG
jgi:hypothetical protein